MPKINTPEGDFDRERRVCLDWFDGSDSAMQAFAFSKPFDPVKLRDESRAAISECQPADISRGDNTALERLATLCEGWIEQRAATDAFVKALERCKKACIDPYDIQKLYEKHFSR